MTTECTPNPTVSGHFSVQQFRLNGKAGSTISITVHPTGFKAIATIYQGPFLQSSPVADCFSSATGSASGSAVSVSAGAPDLSGFPQTYSLWTLVVSGAGTRQTGSWTATIASSNTGVSLGWDAPVSTDKTPPVITVPANIAAAATSSSGATVNYSATATDNVDGAVTPTCSPASGSVFPLGATTVTCNAQDSSGNNATPKTFKVTVKDQTAPTITGQPSGGTYVLEATSSAGATLTTLGLTATDNVDSSPSLSCTPTLPHTYTISTHPNAVSCTAKDAANNSTTIQLGVTVSDTTGPSLTVPSNVTVEATSAAGATVNYTTSATDLVDGAVTPVCAPASGSTFALGTGTVSCSATDAHGNKSSKTFHVTVRDTTGPVVTVPLDLTVEATGPAGAAATFNATAHDAVDGDVIPVCSPASGSTFAIGRTTVTCRALDNTANQGSASFTVVVGDTTAPVLALPSSATAEATGPDGAPVSFVVAATDAVDGARPVTCSVGSSPVVSGAVFALGATTVTCTSVDTQNNRATGSFIVTVTDTTPPVVSVPGDITVQASGPNGAQVTFSVSAIDAVDGATPVSCSTGPSQTVASGSTLPIGTSTVTCQSFDKKNNLGVGTFKITVTPAAQTITFPAPANITYGQPAPTLGATASSGLTVSYTASGACTVSGSTLTITSAGTCAVTAHQAGNATYVAAADVERDFTVNRISVKLSKITGGISTGYTTQVTDAVTGRPVTTGTVSFYGTPGFLCTAPVIKGSATCSIPAADRGRYFVIQLGRGLGVTGEFDAPNYNSAQTTNGLPGAPGID